MTNGGGTPMANDRKTREVIHYGTLLYVTPFQEWHNELALTRVPERTSHGTELAGRSTTGTLVRSDQLTHGEFYEDLPAPVHAVTCGLSQERPVEICQCRQGEHE
ncbi:hypothetical protein ACWD5R_39515 [Streptomyces sp. NPDC002514]|uniref:hypothetical protein n=1 Tax=Streptomyces sp. NPDC001270 TaxID=3364554 RepID=UPI0036AF29E0